MEETEELEDYINYMPVHIGKWLLPAAQPHRSFLAPPGHQSPIIDIQKTS
jgi:hypothetical protein